MAAEKTDTIVNHPAVEVRGLLKDYGRRRVLDLDAFTVERGTICAVTGPNGSGKTTLLTLLALLEKPSKGTILLFGDDVSGQQAGRRRMMRRLVMLQERPWMFQTTVLANVLYGLTARGIARKEARRRASAALEVVGMTHAVKWFAPELSAGENRRVALARALVLKPELALLDEPMTDVDSQHSHIIERVISKLPEGGTTVVLATHRLEVAHRLAHQCIALEGGRICESTLEENRND